MLHTSRALQRANDAASARAAVTGRRPRWILGTITGGLVGIAFTVGVVAGPAAGAELPEGVADMAALVTGVQPLAKSTDDTALTIAPARQAADAAEALNAEVADSGLDLGGAPQAVDTADLRSWLSGLADREDLSEQEIDSLTAYVQVGRDEVVADTAALTTAYQAAQEAKAEAEQAAAAADALASANTVEGAKATARAAAAQNYGWGDDQFSCLDSLWTKESGWNYQAYNSSGATGIPQALPGSKMASAGSDWATSAATQIIWGLGYISSVYGSPCSAWSHSQSTNWY